MVSSENNTIRSKKHVNRVYFNKRGFLLSQIKQTITDDFCTFIKRIMMKNLLFLVGIVLAIYSCDASKSTMGGDVDSGTVSNDTIRIANDSLEYEVIIIEPRFNTWLLQQPPRGFYGLNYLEIKNQLFVSEYNARARNPQQFSPTLYPQEINYDFNVEYGYEVNYLLYNYFVYFQQQYNQKLPGGRG